MFVQEEDLNKNMFEGLLQCPEKVILMRVIMTLMIIGDHMMNEDTLEGEHITMIEVEDHHIEEMSKREVIQEMVDPLMMMVTLMMVYP